MKIHLKVEIKTGKLYKIKEKACSYFTTISIPGVPGIFTGNNILLKIIWTLLMLGLFGVGFWNIALAVNDFYNYDVITNIERVTPDNITFPAITICFVIDSILRKRIVNQTLIGNAEFISPTKNKTLKKKSRISFHRPTRPGTILRTILISLKVRMVTLTA